MPGSRRSGLVASHLAGVETAEELAIPLTLLQDGVPAESGLRAFEDQKFEPAAIVVNRDAPFLVVV